MRSVKVRPGRSLQSIRPLCNRREQRRASVDFQMMYSAQDTKGDVLIGDGTISDLSRYGLGISGNTPMKVGMELTLFLYLPDGHDPLFVMEARVVWSRGYRFGVQITKMNLREQNRLRYFLATHLQPLH